MRKLTLCLFIALQAIYFVGTVCGSNVSVSTSMECCKNGHMDAMQGHDMACCKHCDMGKKTVVKFERGLLKDSVRIPVSAGNICKINLTVVQIENSSDLIASTRFTAFSPPEFIAHKQLLI